MGKPILYGIDLSPPVRAVLLTAEAIELDIEFRNVNLLLGEHKSEEYIKKNPQHTVPTLEDNGKFIWDSHAIVTYLIGKYGKNDSLYSKDLYKRAMIDQRLHFDSGILFPRLRACTKLILMQNPNIPQENIDNIYEAYDFVEKFLEDNIYIIGNTLTVADFSCVATISSAVAFAPISPGKYPKICAWIKRLEELPYYESKNANGAKRLIEVLKNKIAELKAQQ